MATRVMGLMLSACLAAGMAWGQEPGTPPEAPKVEPVKPKELKVRVFPRPVQVQRVQVVAPEAKLVVRRKPAAEQRQSKVVHLRYVPAKDLADTLGAVVGADESLPAEGVSIVPEQIGNSLIVSAPSERMEALLGMIDDLDRPPAMVAVEVAVAEIKLNAPETSDRKATGFGTPTGKDKPAGFGESGAKDQPPGFGRPASKDKPPAFGQPKKEEPSSKAPEGNDRLRARLKAAGLDLDAASEDLDKQIAALQQRGRVEVLNRAILSTLNNQPAMLQVGERKPTVTGSAVSGGFSRGGSPSRPPMRQFSVSYQNVGLIVGVTPVVNADGVVTMEIEVEKSWLGSDDEGPAVAESDSGGPVRAPRVRTTTAKSTVSAADGKTVVLGGLTTRSETEGEQIVILVTPRILHPGQ